MIWSTLHAFMAGNSAIAAAATSYPVHLPPQNQAYPAITYSVDDDQDDQLLDGIGSLTQALVTVDCWAMSYLGAHQLADIVKSEFVGYSGSLGNGITAGHIRKTREIDLYESDTRLHRVNLQFLIAYST